MRLAILILLVSATVAQADELTDHLETRLKYVSIKERLVSFFHRNKVKNGHELAAIIAEKKVPERRKKLLAAIIVPESRGNAKAVSPKGAEGICQIMPAWKRKLGIKGSLFDPRVNIYAANEVYSIHLAEAGNEAEALFDYSGGSRWYPKKVIRLMESI